MSAAEDGGPAFPVSDMSLHGTFGMTLRDWFAGQAMLGLVTTLKSEDWPMRKDVSAFMAETAYAQADSMLSERAKGGAA